MAERFQIESVRVFVEALFVAAGLPADDAEVCADAFLLQELRGVRSHGLRRLRQRVLDVQEGRLNATPNRHVLREDDTTVVLDADGGVGILGCMEGMQRAVDIAKRRGLGFALVVNSNHFLAAAPYCVRAAEQGVIGIALANGHSSMAYPGTNVGVLGNSPMGFGIPTGAGFPLIFDAALTISGGRMMQWSEEGLPIPDGFLGYDAAGNYTTSPQAVLDGGVPLPIGLHKGGGLAILMDVLTSVFAGSFLRTLVPEGHEEWRWTSNSHSFIAIDIERFMPREAFLERMAAYVADIKAKPLAPGYDEILLPGERAARSLEDCAQYGVPVDADVVSGLEDLSRRFGLAIPLRVPIETTGG